ncbi:unnamed protein product [Cylicostephanus goldi]|uniref:Uncharacterized protein n=1 Tax=Cylicostephanus goldi TaxID=71465 RepID=A0A3P6RB41_CYLGO|nr:unnamed protein product [Cylicostephanus goldi]
MSGNRLSAPAFQQSASAAAYRHQKTMLMVYEQPIPMSKGQIRSLFLVNSLPFIGFGFLDNLIMICAGEYIDQVSSIFSLFSILYAVVVWLFTELLYLEIYTCASFCILPTYLG